MVGIALATDTNDAMSDNIFVHARRRRLRPYPSPIESVSSDTASITIRRFLIVALAWCLVAGATFTATLTGLAALGSAFGVLRLPYALVLLDERMPGIFRLHMVASGLGLIVLPWALLLRHSHAAHRAVGRAAAALLMVGLAASLPCALLSEALPVARAGFAAQGLLGLALLTQAVNAISRGRMVPHKRAMLRAASLLSGVVVLRLMVWAAAAWPANFDMAYAVIAWLSWVIPLTTAELWLQRRFRFARLGNSRRARRLSCLQNTVGPA